jgi:hypothetical protein
MFAMSLIPRARALSAWSASEQAGKIRLFVTKGGQEWLWEVLLLNRICPSWRFTAFLHGHQAYLEIALLLSLGGIGGEHEY